MSVVFSSFLCFQYFCRPVRHLDGRAIFFYFLCVCDYTVCVYLCGGGTQEGGGQKGGKQDVCRGPSVRRRDKCERPS